MLALHIVLVPDASGIIGLRRGSWHSLHFELPFKLEDRGSGGLTREALLQPLLGLRAGCSPRDTRRSSSPVLGDGAVQIPEIVLR